MVTGNARELKTANRTRGIICMKELWVPSPRIGGCRPGGVALGGFFEGGGGGMTFGAR